MTLRPLCVLLLAAPVEASRLVAPRLAPTAPRVVLGAPLVIPALSPAGPAALSAPLGAPSMFSAPVLPPAPLAPLLAAPAAADAPKHLPLGLPDVPMPNFIPQAARADAPLEDLTRSGRVRFDLASPASGDAVVDARSQGNAAPALAPGWSLGSFKGEGDADIVYKSRSGADASRPARVYFGGLALNESFETLFARGKPKGPEHFMWTRAHAPSGWVPTRSPLDADALDMARMLLTASRTSQSGKTELVLHSFGTLVFQRMVQMRGIPLVDAALRTLSGSRAVFLHGTTRYEGSERRAGREFEQMGQATRAFTDWLNTADDMVALWEKTARLNPFLGPAVDAWLAQWRVQREQVLAMASRDAIAMMRRDLAEPWSPELEPMRKEFLASLERNARDSAWQEALLRRSGDMFRLEMTPADVKHLRKLGVDVEMVHSRGDKLLNWETARALLDFYGLPAPETMPPAGVELTGKGARAVIVDGDHYWPLKQPDALRRVLDR